MELCDSESEIPTRKKITGILAHSMINQRRVGELVNAQCDF